MKRHLLLTTVSVLAIPFVVLTGTAPAMAAGCGGYVNILQWGCAPWDNNPPKKGVTPGYPAVTPKVTVQPAASVIATDSAGLAKTGGHVVSNDGASVVSNDGASAVAKNNAGLVGNAGGTLVGNASGTLVGNASGTLVGNASGTFVGHNGSAAISDNGSGLVSNAGGTLVGNASGTFVGNNGSAVIQKSGSSIISDNSAGLVGNAGGTLVSNAGGTLVGNASGTFVGNNGSAFVGNNGSAVVQKNGNGIISDNSEGIISRDGAGLITQDGGSLTLKGPNAYKAVAPADTQKQAAVQPAPGPTQLQIDTANAAAAVAAKDAAAAKAASDAISGIAVGANRPTDPVKLADDNNKLAAAAVVSAQANLSKAQSDLVAMSAKGASAYDIQGQKDLIAKDQANLNYQKEMVKNDYVGKAIAADTARADLATAKTVVDGLTKVYGSRPADPQQLTIVNTAMAVQALAQDKADMAAADAAAVRLAANGASKSDVQTQTDLVATKQKDMANILKANPTVAAAVGTAANAGPDAVNKAISGLVAAAKTQTTLAVQLTDTQVQAALAAVQQLKTGTYSIKSLDAPVGAAASTAPSGPVVAATSPATNPVVATAPVVAAVQAPVVDKSELTPAVVQMLVQSGPATIQAMQSAQQAALAKGDKAMADGLGKDIVNLQAQVAAAKAMPPVTTTAVAATTTATTSPATGAATAAQPVTSPAVVANASPTAPAVASTASVAAAVKPAETAAPAKISEDQSKAVHQALRTIPGDLTKPEQKSFAALSAMVDRATTKGLTAEEATYLKEGIEALAQKHPKAEKQSGLTRIANTVAVQKPAVATAAPVGATASPPVVAVAPAASAMPTASAMPSPVQPSQPRAPEQATIRPESPKSASATPAVTVQPAAPKTEMRNEPKPTIASTTPAAVAPTKPAATHEVHIEPHPAAVSKPAPVAAPAPVTRVEPARAAAPVVRAAPPVVTAPKPPAMAANKPPAPPAAKPQSCTPNMVNGKMMGMTCH